MLIKLRLCGLAWYTSQLCVRMCIQIHAMDNLYHLPMAVSRKYPYQLHVPQELVWNSKGEGGSWTGIQKALGGNAVWNSNWVVSALNFHRWKMVKAQKLPLKSLTS